MFTPRQLDHLSFYIGEVIGDSSVEIRSTDGLVLHKAFIRYYGRDDREYSGTITFTCYCPNDDTVEDFAVMDLTGQMFRKIPSMPVD